MNIEYAYAADITKSERDENGDLFVYGKATGPDLDLDDQVCDAGWLKSAMPAWFEFGNVREMHQPVAAGVGVELTEADDGWYLKSRVVDRNTASKIEAGVLKGYSVGIKNAKIVKDASAPNGRISGGDIVEVSYVDRPCNPTSKTAICKAIGSTDLEPVEAEDDAEKSITQSDVEKAVKDAVEVATAALTAQVEELVKAGKPAANDDASDDNDDDDVDDNVNGGGKAGKGKKKTGKTNGSADDNDADNKTTDADLVKQIEAAVTKVSKGSEDRIKSIESQLTEVLSRPVPGGPVIAQTTQVSTTASAHLEKAARYRVLAGQVQGDPDLKASYERMAKELETEH